MIHLVGFVASGLPHYGKRFTKTKENLGGCFHAWEAHIAIEKKTKRGSYLGSRVGSRHFTRWDTHVLQFGAFSSRLGGVLLVVVPEKWIAAAYICLFSLYNTISTVIIAPLLIGEARSPQEQRDDNVHT